MFEKDKNKDSDFRNNHTSGNWIIYDSTYKKLSDTLYKWGCYGSIFDYGKDDKNE